ncbi:MAG: hypothetical protein EPN91_10650 [Salinibacterium sp.]|nr:MAG: hypothetical protein EPN91_10650 [Salinibacterium sp.]
MVIEDGEAYFLDQQDYIAFLEDRVAGGQTCITKFSAVGIGTIDADVSGLNKHSALALLVKAEAEVRDEAAAEEAYEQRTAAFA